MEIAIWIAFFAAQLADVWTTNKVLSQGGREANPVVKWLMDRGLWPWAKVIAATGAAGVVWYLGYPWGVAAIAALTGAVAFNNYRQVR